MMRRTFESRFWSKVKKTEACWLWNGCIDRGGYGTIGLNGKVVKAHRAIWQVLHGEIPKGLCVDHKCRVRSCVNPSHLRVVTYKENATENSTSIAARNSKKTHCIRGHKFTKENTYPQFKGSVNRGCKECKKFRYHHKQRQLQAEEKAALAKRLL